MIAADGFSNAQPAAHPARPAIRVLLVHNFYRSESPSGESAVLAAEKAMLEARGHQVACFTVDSSDIARRGLAGALTTAVGVPWNLTAASRMREVLQAFEPDVVHIHNTFPRLSPSILFAIGNRAARVMTLHNYRLFCSAGIPMRARKVCTRCLDVRSPMPGLLHGCYRASRIATAPLAASIWLHRQLGTWRHQVEAFIALSEYQAGLMCDAGLPIERMHVKPNFLSRPAGPVVAWSQREDKVVFAGRLAPEKGVETLVRAWLRWGEAAPELLVLGDGPLRGHLERLVARCPNAHVRLGGHVAREEVDRELARAKLAVLPSEGLEPFGMVVLEAFARGTPVAVADVGPLRSLLAHEDQDLVFPAGDEEALLTTVRRALANPAGLQQRSERALSLMRSRYTEEDNYARLLSIYRAAIEYRQRRHHGEVVRTVPDGQYEKS